MTSVRIVILGGGTAGWMAANLFAARWPGRAAVTVIESEEIGIVGVGEGSTPQLKAFFDQIGLAEADWMPRANATYKVGIRFRGWSERPGFGEYFHPFPSHLDLHTAPAFFHNARARRQGVDLPAHPDPFFVPAALAHARRGPRAAETFPFEVSYGYHFDAHLVGAVLRDHSVARGVTRLERTIAEVGVSAGGRVTHLTDTDGNRIEGDLFVDASGFRAVIAEAALGAKFLPFADNLMNDSAVVMPTAADPDSVPSETVAIAMQAGWRWIIPLTNRCGNGYVYSSRYISAEDAEAELRAALGPQAADTPARHLKMKVGRLADSWTSNCLAIGLAQGFIEPLEATALHIVQATVEGFMAAYEQGGFTDSGRDGFNRAIAARYEGIRDYIVCHYRVNRRTDTPYWRDNAANQALSDSLKGVLTSWFTGARLEDEIERQGIARYYAPASWACLLAGYGTFPDDAKLKPPPPGAPGYDMAVIHDFVTRCALNFADHKATLKEMAGA